MEQTIFQLLDVENESELRGAFNNQAGELITSIRAAKQSGSNCAAQENELATLILALFRYSASTYRYSKASRGPFDLDDIVQEAVINACDAAGNASKTIKNPYGYFLRTLKNCFLNCVTRRHPVKHFSALDGDDPDGASSVAASIVSRENPSLREKIAREIGENELSELLANNGFTPEEKAVVEHAIEQVMRRHPLLRGYQETFKEYYLGEMLTPSFVRSWKDQMTTRGVALGTFKSSTHALKKYLREALQELYPDFRRNGLEGKLERIEDFRRTFRDDVSEVALPEGQCQTSVGTISETSRAYLSDSVGNDRGMDAGGSSGRGR